MRTSDDFIKFAHRMNRLPPYFFGRIYKIKSEKQKADVAASPGVCFGEEGEGYLRIALVENENRIRQIKSMMLSGRENGKIVAAL